MQSYKRLERYMATCGPYESPSSWPPFHDPHLRLFLLPIQNLICHIVFVLIVSFAPAACNCPHRRRSEGSVMASRSKAAAPKRKKTKRRREEGRVGTTESSSRCHRRARAKQFGTRRGRTKRRRTFPLFFCYSHGSLGGLRR